VRHAYACSALIAHPRLGHVLDGDFAPLVPYIRFQDICHVRSIRRDDQHLVEGSADQDRAAGTSKEGTSRFRVPFLPRRSESPNACFTPPQMFTIFFAHLTTYIAEVDIRLRTHPTVREQLPPDRKITEFKVFFDKTEKSMTVEMAKLPGEGTIPEENYEDDEYSTALAGLIDLTSSEEKTKEEEFVSALHWKPTRFFSEWKKNQLLLKVEKFSRENRVAPRMGERFLVMSGIEWNHRSQNVGRDWPNILAASTLEVGIVETYRTDLLKHCPGARALREEIGVYLRSIASPFHDKHPTTGKPRRVNYWDFPDKIELTVAPGTVPTMYDPDDMKVEFQTAISLTSGKGRDKRKGENVTVEALVNNELLWSSEPDTSSGTMETLAFHCITTLKKASRLLLLPCVLLFPCPSRSPVDLHRSSISTPCGGRT
jgi:hypothetical protein